MKWLVALLALCNAAYFAWMALGEQTAGPELVPVVPRAIAPRTLTLLAEAPQPAVVSPPSASSVEPAQPEPTSSAHEPAPTPPEEPAVSPAPAEPEPAQFCYEVTGIEKRTDQEVLRSQLVKSGATLVGEGERQMSRQTYWVLLPPFASLSAAEAFVAKLAKARAGDFYIVRSGEFTNAISLGVFSTKEAAQRRLNQFRAVRIKAPSPRIEAIELPAKRFWIAYSAPEALSVPLPNGAVSADVSCPSP